MYAIKIAISFGLLVLTELQYLGLTHWGIRIMTSSLKRFWSQGRIERNFFGIVNFVEAAGTQRDINCGVKLVLNIAHRVICVLDDES